VYARVYGGAYEAIDTHTVQCDLLHVLSSLVWDSVRITRRVLNYGFGSHMIEKSLEQVLSRG
jgi:hypothetical protein